MNVLSSVLSFVIDSKLRRVVKGLGHGKRDVQTAIEISPYGIDGGPIKDIIALRADTNENGRTVVLGYQCKNQKALAGELRTYATDENGEEVFYTWMKRDGVMEIGGDSNWATRFNELKTEFNKLKQSHNDLLTEYIAHIHSGGTISGSTGTTVSTQTPNDSNIDNAKNDKIKTI